MLRKAAVIAVMLATTTAVAACGGSGPTTSATLSKTPHRNAGLALAQCMRSHGVPDFPDPQSGGAFGIQASGGNGNSIVIDGHTLNVSAPAFEKAMQQCRKNTPQGPPISGAQLAKIKQGALKMAECMRTHGVPNFPDPRVSVGPGGHGIAVQMGFGNTGGSKVQGPPRSPAFQHAMQSCQPLMRVGPKAQKATG